MDTKLKGDIAEQAVILKCLEYGYDVLIPIGDRLPYDLVIINNSKFIKIQVKSAWIDKVHGSYYVDTRRAKTNRKIYKIEKYNNSDFDFAILFIQDLNTFYIMPSDIFNGYKSAIALRVNKTINKVIKSDSYMEAWNLIDIF